MLKVLAVGDPHFSKNPSFLAPGEWRKHVSDMLEAALQAALSNRADILVLLGDIFDNSNPSPQDIAEVVSFVFRARKLGMQVVMFNGNHDYIDSTVSALEPFARMVGKCKVISKPKTMKMGGVSVQFVPWSPPDVKYDIASIKDKTPYLIFHHTELEGSLADNGWALSGAIPRKKDFLVGGHLHTWQLIKERSLFVGTALVSHWGHEVKGFSLIEAKMEDGKLCVKHEQIPYTVPFLMKEISLATFNKKYANKKDKIPTYYRLILQAGEEVPDDKRVVSHNRISRKSLETALDEAEMDTLATLPHPITWLVDMLPKEKRKRALNLLRNVRRSKEEFA